MRLDRAAFLAASASILVIAAPGAARAQEQVTVVAPVEPPAPWAPTYVKGTGPRVIKDWSPDQPTPPGYHPSERIRLWAVITGASLTATAYGVAVLGGLVTEASTDGCHGVDPSNGCYRTEDELFIPVLGPLIALTRSGNAPGMYTFDAIDGVVQVGGVVMLALGIAMPKTILVRDDVASVHGVQLSLVPNPGARAERDGDRWDLLIALSAIGCHHLARPRTL